MWVGWLYSDYNASLSSNWTKLELELELSLAICDWYLWLLGTISHFNDVITLLFWSFIFSKEIYFCPNNNNNPSFVINNCDYALQIYYCAECNKSPKVWVCEFVSIEVLSHQTLSISFLSIYLLPTYLPSYWASHYLTPACFLQTCQSTSCIW